ncbi:hypothetical protein [Terasakiella pusilla]|uniref:hypothetical protein n=1 Tax=Terasakiella pusilla TaxID=64973 RepID=UPI0004904196|nr:hypothetical protein [Terasakiella pusilla]
MDLNKPEKLTFRVDHFLGATPDLNVRIHEGLIGIRKVVKKFDDLQARIKCLEAENSELKVRLSRLENSASDLIVNDDLKMSHLKLVEKPEYVH